MQTSRRLFILLTCWTLWQCVAAGPMRQITGMVRDSATHQGIAYATVTLVGCDESVMANDVGGFNINTRAEFTQLRVKAMGYDTKTVTVGADQTIVLVDMTAGGVRLDEVTVSKTKEKYSKKNNPAVEFVKRLRSRRHENDPTREPYYSYDMYEHVMYGFNDVSDDDALMRKMGFLTQYADTSDVTGKRILPIAVKEKAATRYYRQQPRSHKELVTGVKNEGLDKSFDEASIKRFIDDVIGEIDIFNNDVTLLTNRFVSPLSAIGPDFYKYYLNDTVAVDGERCVELVFVPFNNQAFGFLGRVYVPLNDTTMFIKKVRLNVPRNINLNYVEQLYIEQDFDRAPSGARLKTYDRMEVELKLISTVPQMFARRETTLRHHSFEPPQDMGVFDGQQEVKQLEHAEDQSDAFWAANRSDKYRGQDSKVRQMLDRLRESKFFYWGEKVIVSLINGYVPTGSPGKWDFGPLNTLVNYNKLEGFRMRLGGMTTTALSRHWFARGYAAYGFGDRKLKYKGQIEYSFSEKKNLDQDFPIHSIRLYHQYDVDKLGQHYLYTNADNMFLVLKRKADDKLAYLRKTALDYRREWPNHFSLEVGVEHNVHEATRYIPFYYNDSMFRRRYTEAGFHVTLRYAPGETFYQMRTMRVPINMDAPVITLTQTYFPRGFLGSLFEVNKTEVGLQKRFWFSAFGYTDIILKGAKIWSKVAYPDLLLPNANLSYTIQNESYSLMNAMEFANDQYLSWDVTYWANGALLNYVPLLRRMKLREVVSWRGLWGSLSDKNNPDVSHDVFRFPARTNCRPMGETPYMEMGVGIDNILTFLRVDYVWRLTYRHNPGTDRRGVRIQFHFTF